MANPYSETASSRTQGNISRTMPIPIPIAGTQQLSPPTSTVLARNNINCMVFFPRTFDELDAQLSDIHFDLQQLDAESRDLMGRLALAAENRPGDYVLILKRRLLETVGQEKRALERPGQLQLEIQCRERKYQVQQDLGISWPWWDSPQTLQEPKMGVSTPPVTAGPITPPGDDDGHRGWPEMNQTMRPLRGPTLMYQKTGTSASYQAHIGKPDFTDDAHANGSSNDKLSGRVMDGDSSATIDNSPDSTQQTTRSHHKRKSLPPLQFSWVELEKEEQGDKGHLCRATSRTSERGRIRTHMDEGRHRL